MEYSFEKREAVEYYVHRKDSSVWGIAFISDSPGRHLLSIQSDYGDYSYHWTSIGDRPLIEFLVGLSMDYAMGKLCGSRDKMFEYDHDETRKALFQEIRRARRDREITKQDARKFRTELVGYDCDYSSSAMEYVSNLEVWCPNMMREMFCDLSDTFPVRNRIRPQVQGFWDEVWPMFVDIWKRQLRGKNYRYAPVLKVGEPDR